MDLNVSLIKTKGILIIILFILILGVNVISATDCNIDLNDLGDVGDLNDLGDVGDLNDSGDVGDFDYNVSFFYDNLKEDGSNYSSFLLYLIDCGFYLDVNNSNFENNDFLLISSKNHTFKLYSGENYTVPIGGIYYVSFENRVDYYLGGICYPDVIYMVNGTYYLDEDYLSWLKYNQGLNASNFGSVVLNFTNKNILLNDVFEEDYNNFINLNSYSSGTSIYFPHELININYSNLPIYYNLDDYGWISPIKKQIYGDCWSFAVISALESFLLKSENISYNFSNDFSENHLKNVMSSRGINGSSKFEGGNLFLALAYLLRWSGPINEINDPYNGTNYSYEYFSPLKHVQDVLFISSRYNSSDNNHIKEAILKHGAVATNMILDSNYVEGNTYYFPWEEIFHKSTSEVKNMISNMVSGHSVVIVGWDDSYSANAFKRTLKFFEDGEGICWNNISFVPKNNGAFIIKDSATGKLLYVSYEDPSLGWFGSFGGIGSFVFTNVENVTNYKSIYQSDNLGILAYKNFTNTSIVLSNMFISESNETIVAIGFYALQNTNCTIKIIVNNLCRFSKVYTDICAGYHTFDLDKNDYINLTQNDTFQIRIILNNNNYLVPFSSLQSSNLSYICLNNTWYFCPKLCIKAYTGFSSDVGMSSISSSDISMVYGDNKSLVAVLKDGSGNVIVGKQVILTILDKINSSRVLGKYSLVSDFNGKVIWKINLNIGNYRGIFSFGGDDNFTGSDKVVWITINKQSSSISSNYWCYYGDNLIITIKSGIKFLSGKKISININGKNYYKMTDNNGKAILNIKLKNNKYPVTISFAGDSIYKSSSKKLTFTVCNAPAKLSLNAYSSPYKSGKTFNIKVFNTKTNKIIVGINLKIKVYTSSNYKIYTVTTGKDGVAKFGASSLSIGLHNIHVYSGDQYVKFNKVKSTIKISKANTIVSAPKVINVYKVKSYFKVTVKHKSSCKIISNLKICIKVYTGSKYKTYTITTNNKGMAYLNTAMFSVGTHKVTISSLDDHYSVSGYSSIVIKKK